jgi:hypothetical protein
MSEMDNFRAKREKKNRKRKKKNSGAGDMQQQIAADIYTI